MCRFCVCGEGRRNPVASAAPGWIDRWVTVEYVVGVVAAITGGEERTNKERVVEYDEENGTMAWEMVDDHRYSKLVTSMKVVECSNGDDCILHWQMEYEPRDNSILPPEDIKMVHFESMKAIQNHCDQHPHWP